MTIEEIEEEMCKTWKQYTPIQDKTYLDTGQLIIERHFKLLEHNLESYELAMQRGLAEGQRREKVRSR